jgi:hypothetical protein
LGGLFVAREVLQDESVVLQAALNVRGLRGSISLQRRSALASVEVRMVISTVVRGVSPFRYPAGAGFTHLMAGQRD